MKKSINWTKFGILGALMAMLMMPTMLQAQRPSLGGLQSQIDGLLNGQENFSEVRFGDECTIGIDPDFTGLTERDPNGFRLLGQDNQGCILRFGPTDFCTVGVDPQNPGLTLRDVDCFRFINPLGLPPKILLEGGQMRFGDECTIGIDPNFPGLTESDPNGFRLLGQNGQGCILRFGPSDLCTIGIDPTVEGMVFRDVGCFRFENPTGEQPEVQINGGLLRFGRSCTLGIDPNLSGMVESDPGGLRLLGQNGEGCILTFGPADTCRILVDPQRPEIGLITQEIRPVLFESPAGQGLAQVRVDGTLFANEFAQLSRGDLKENVRPIENALEKVKKLRGVTFDWKAEAKKNATGPNGSADFGFIAEEVAEVISEAAIYDEDGKTAQGVKYSNMVSLVVEAVKTQQTQIDSQKQQLATQQETIAAQQDRLDSQQDQLDDQQHMIEQLQQQLASLLEK